jgi:hypothetical protein
MKKITLIIVFLCLVWYGGIAQYLKKDTTGYASRSLKLDEVNLVTAYYNQTGDHSTTLGGLGSEHVNEISTAIDLKFVGYTNPNYIHSLTAGLGYAHHTAASAAWISKTGASRTAGDRIYPSLDWSLQNVKMKTEYSAGAMFSDEYNYKSLTLNTGFSKANNSNGEFGIKFTGSFDRVKLIYAEMMAKSDVMSTHGGTATPSNNIENDSSGKPYQVSAASNGSSTTSGILSTSTKRNLSSTPRTTLTAAFSYNQVINPRMQMALLADLTGQFGYLGLPFHRVFMADADSSKLENLPRQRLKLPLAVRWNYFAGDNVIFRAYYRFYTDSWGIIAHTASLEMPVKLSSFISLSPFYRYYTQTASKYFAPFAQHVISEEYYTSNYSYSAFSSQFYGLGIRWSPLNAGIFKTVELRYGRYTQTTGLKSNVITLDLKF